MLIYQAPSDRFIDEVRENTISDIMSDNYKARPGLNWNAALEAGGVLVSDDIRISCEVQLVNQS